MRPNVLSACLCLDGVAQLQILDILHYDLYTVVDCLDNRI